MRISDWSSDVCSSDLGSGMGDMSTEAAENAADTCHDIGGPAREDRQCTGLRADQAARNGGIHPVGLAGGIQPLRHLAGRPRVDRGAVDDNGLRSGPPGNAINAEFDMLDCGEVAKAYWIGRASIRDKVCTDLQSSV